MTQTFKERMLALGDDFARVQAAKDGAYAERNMVVAGLAVLAMQQGWTVGVGLHDPSDVAWEPEWRSIVFIDLPTGQVSWHVHEEMMGLFRSLPVYPGQWDGHTTAEKYRRLAALRFWVHAKDQAAGAEPLPPEPFTAEKEHDG